MQTKPSNYASQPPTHPTMPANQPPNYVNQPATQLCQPASQRCALSVVIIIVAMVGSIITIANIRTPTLLPNYANQQHPCLIIMIIGCLMVVNIIWCY